MPDSTIGTYSLVRSAAFLWYRGKMLNRCRVRSKGNEKISIKLLMKSFYNEHCSPCIREHSGGSSWANENRCRIVLDSTCLSVNYRLWMNFKRSIESLLIFSALPTSRRSMSQRFEWKVLQQSKYRMNVSRDFVAEGKENRRRSVCSTCPVTCKRSAKNFYTCVWICGCVCVCVCVCV